MSWTDTDARALRRYLTENPTFAMELQSRAPAIDVTSSDTCAMTGSQHAGFELAIPAITAMATPSADPQKSPFIRPETMG